MADKKKIRIKIAKDGTYTLEAMEGFSGESCVEKTKNIEIMLGGQAVARGKKDEYYDPDATPELTLNTL
jgi:hypothetical protein